MNVKTLAIDLAKRVFFLRTGKMRRVMLRSGIK
jgi:hypothetical protein